MTVSLKNFLYDISKKKGHYIKHSLPIIRKNSTRFHNKTYNSLEETPSYACLKGSFTVEAALVVPVMAIILVMVLYGFRILQVQTCVEGALVSAAEQTAVYAQSVEDNSALKLCGVVLAKSEIKKSGCPLEYVSGKLAGITFLSSKTDGDYIKLTATYKVQFPFDFFFKKTVSVTQSAYSRKWTGYDKTSLGDDDETYVYITPDGSAYHATTKCSYLKLSIKTVSYARIKELRNKSGSIFDPCPLCVKGKPGTTVYITDYGECYHNRLSCSGLKRTIYHVLKSEAEKEGYHSCGKCWGKAG